ncbi:MAG: ATP-binding domain-containing protein [Ilumatobacteraceae bacterium]
MLRLAVGTSFPDVDAVAALLRDRAEHVDDVRWSAADVALLDDARDALGPIPDRHGKIDESDEIRTFGHIVIDEVQDLSPMQLKMATRRSLNGSMTVVGDLAQATGAHAPDSWDDITRYLPDRRPPRIVGLSVGYRIPEQIMDLANRVMHVATPGLRAPRAVRLGDTPPMIIEASNRSDVFATAAEQVQLTASEVKGNIAVVVADVDIEEMSRALSAAGVAHGHAARNWLDDAVTVVPVSIAKGLELDGVVVVEPADIVASQSTGLRALYVALTRSTQRLTVVHAASLPGTLQPQPSAA